MTGDSNRRKFITRLVASTAALAVGTGFKPVQAKAIIDATEDGAHRFVVPPYIQALSPTQVSLLCITSKKAYTWIEYGIGHLSERAHHVQDGLVDANNTLARITLKGLQPNTEYSYRIVSKEILSFEPYKLEYGAEIKSNTYTFKTPDRHADSVSAVILNDVHDRPESYSTLLGLMKEKPYEFVVLNGDLFDYQTDEKQLVDHLLLPCANLFAGNIPFILNRGNHETRGKYARELKKYFDYPDNKYYQAFQQGPVFWIVLDTGEDKPDDHPVYAGIVDFDTYRKEQAEWLERVMDSEEYKAALYKVVVMHIPPHHSGEWHGPSHCRELFSPLFEKNNVDVVISGHTHRLGIHPPEQEHAYHIVIGGGPREGNRTLVHVAADKQKLSVTMLKDDGSEVGTVIIDTNKRKR